MQFAPFADLGYNLGSLEFLKRMNINLVDDILCYFCFLAKKTDCTADTLIKLLKMLTSTFKDLVVITENSAIVIKFTALFRNEQHKQLFGVHDLKCAPSVALKIY